MPGDLMLVASNGVSVNMVQVGHNQYPLRTNQKCNTCKCDHRFLIEKQIVQYQGYAAIGRLLVDMDHSGCRHAPDSIPDARSIAGHVKREEMVSPAIIRREIAEARARQQGVDVYEVNNIITDLAVSDMIIQQVAEGMIDGSLKPTIPDAQRAMEFKQKVEGAKEEGFTSEIWEAIFFSVYDVMSRELPPEQFQQVVGAINRNPMIRALTVKAKGAQAEQAEQAENEEPEDVEEASIVGD